MPQQMVRSASSSSEQRVQRVPEGVVHGQVVEGEALGELGRALLRSLSAVRSASR
jgi:hypothetical protein